MRTRAPGFGSRSRVRRELGLHEEIKVHTQYLNTLTRTTAPGHVEGSGSLDVAAEMLATAGDSNDRVRSEPALAQMCGACPCPRLRHEQRAVPRPPTYDLSQFWVSFNANAGNMNGA